VHQLEPDWPTFLADFQRRWPTDAEHDYVNFVRDGLAGNGAARAGNNRWRQTTRRTDDTSYPSPCPPLSTADAATMVAIHAKYLPAARALTGVRV
jgi:hypothetical protein